MPLTLTVPEGYGYVAAIALGVLPFIAYAHGILVGIKRKPAGVKYPNKYASIDSVAKDPKAYAFNCAQRAHGNYMENMPQTMASMLFAGLFYPRATVYIGWAWVFFRLVFAYGYVYGSKPNGSSRLNGSVFWLAQGALWGMSLYAALTELV